MGGRPHLDVLWIAAFSPVRPRRPSVWEPGPEPKVTGPPGALSLTPDLNGIRVGHGALLEADASSDGSQVHLVEHWGSADLCLCIPPERMFEK